MRRLIGIETEEAVPNDWNISRFEDVLGMEPHRTLLKKVFNELAQQLGQVVPDLGRNVAGDATAMNARRKDEAAAAQEGGRGGSGGKHQKSHR